MKEGIIISLGSINLDIQVKADRWPKPGETLLVSDLLTIGGGKAANRAYLTSKLKAPSLLLARLGEDNEADKVLSPLNNMGINLKYVKKLKGQRTGLSMITVRPDGEKTILLAGNVNNNWEEEGAKAVEKVILEAPSDSILTVDLEVTPSVVHIALKTAKKRNFIVVLDPSPANLFKDEYFQLADYITPNISEAESMTNLEIKNVDDGFAACEALIKKGSRSALVKMGDKGTVVIDNGDKEFIPALDARVIDTTGAGDAFTGAFAFAIWDSQKTSDAIRFAISASTLAVEKYGSQPAYPDLEAIEKKLEEFKYI